MIFPSFKNGCDGKLPFTNLIVTTECPHNCIYCIAKKTRELDHKDITVEELAQKAIDIGNECVVLEGGEPLLYPEKVYSLIGLLQPNIKYISMFTSLPNNMNTPENKALFKMMLDRLSRCTISIASTFPKDAADLMGVDDRAWVNEFIKELCRDGYADKFRVSFLLCKDYIATPLRVSHEIQNLLFMGVKEIKIGELALEPKKFVKFTDLFPTSKLGDPIYDGCSTLLTKRKAPKELKFINFKKYRIFIKRVCALTPCTTYKMTNKEKFKLIIRNYKKAFFGLKMFRVLYNDGVVRNSWKTATN